MKKWSTAAFTLLFAAAMCLPAYALAEGSNATTDEPVTQEGATAPAVQEGITSEPLAHMQETEATAPQEPAATAATEPAEQAPAADCYLTFYYYEIVYYEDDEVDDGLRLLGTYVVDGLKPGDVINVWDYVFDIPGHFFFDGTAPSITISADNSKNVIELKYGKLMNSEFTVNYYVMDGANLAADTWAGALDEDTSFHKIGDQTFVNQRFEQKVNGDDFEYPLEGLYAVDTFPQSITLGENPDENVLNVLYVPAMTQLPDDAEIPDAPIIPTTPDTGTTTPTPGPADPEEVIVPTPTVPGSNGPGSIGLPYDPSQMEGVAFSNGQLEAGDITEPIEFTEEMVANPISPETAERYAQAYELGTPLISPLPVVTNLLNIQVGAALMLFLVAFLAVCAYAFERGKQQR